MRARRVPPRWIGRLVPPTWIARLALLTLALAVAAPAGADTVGDAAAPAVDADLVLRSPTAPLQVRWAEVASLTRTVPAIVLAELDRAVDPDRAVAPPALYGELAADLPPAGWPLALEGAVTVAGDAVTPPAGGPGRRSAALWALGTFAIGPGQRDLRVLELRARYQDGIAIWINGVPVARRGLPPGEPTLGLAPRPHGPELETFYVPVVPGLLRAGDNVVAVLVRPSARAPAPRLALAIVGRRAARVVAGPMVQRVGPTAATIVVETDRPATVAVTWSPAAGPPSSLDRAAAVTGDGRHHVAELTDLPVDATVHYRVTVEGVVAAEAAFATAPRPGEVVRLAIYGDVRGGHAVHAALIAQMQAEAPDAVLSTGDLVLRGTDEGDWQRFFAIAGPLLATTPYYPALGNHDVGAGGDRGRRFGDRFALPPGPADRPVGAAWYSFDVGDVHVVALDSNAYDHPAQRAWLEADLAAHADARTVIAIAHDGPFSRGTHGGNPTAARDLVPILVRHRVAVLFSGHDHLYQRGVADGLPYVVTGGGGAPLYPQRCGARHRPRCRIDDGALAVASQHHYVLLTIYPAGLELCPRRVDGTPLEPCVGLRTRTP